MIDLNKVERINSDIDKLVNILVTIVNTEKDPIVNFTKEDLQEFSFLFVSENFTNLLKKKALSSNVVVMTQFKKDDFIMSILSVKNFLQLEKLPSFNATYSISEEERANIHKSVSINKMKLN
jgi:hypothetical protein